MAGKPYPDYVSLPVGAGIVSMLRGITCLGCGLVLERIAEFTQHECAEPEGPGR